MKTIIARNVNDALSQGISLVRMYGEEVYSRAGKTLEIPCPVATVYSNPWERVLINKDRDANPFFHIMESLWILAGREDVHFLKEFNKRMGDYSDDGIVFNAPYGHRLRNNSRILPVDQLTAIIDILSSDPNSRQAVAQIWDERDLLNTTKDKACNMSIVFRIRKNKLDMIVYNRSNDMIWGAYGANMVQFSMIQEYVAANIGIEMGEYTQVTNSYHVYTEGAGGKVWGRIKNKRSNCENPYTGFTNIVRMDSNQMFEFDLDLDLFFTMYDNYGLSKLGELESPDWTSNYFKDLILPILCVYLVYKSKGAEEAMKYTDRIVGEDWRTACNIWLLERVR